VNVTTRRLCLRRRQTSDGRPSAASPVSHLIPTSRDVCACSVEISSRDPARDSRSRSPPRRGTIEPSPGGRTRIARVVAQLVGLLEGRGHTRSEMPGLAATRSCPTAPWVLTYRAPDSYGGVIHLYDNTLAEGHIRLVERPHGSTPTECAASTKLGRMPRSRAIWLIRVPVYRKPPLG